MTTPEYESMVPYGDLSQTALLLAAEEAQMYREGHTREGIAEWLREHGAPHPGTRMRGQR